MTEFDQPIRVRMILQILFGMAAMAVYFAPVPRLRVSSQDRPPAPVLSAVPKPVGTPEINQINTRPLFSETRRPTPPAPPQKIQAIMVAKPVDTTNGMVLLGVLHTRTQAIALVILPNKISPEQIHVGALLGNWRVVKILDDRIELSSETGNAELILPKPNLSPSSQGTSPSNSGIPYFAPPITFPPMRAP